MGKPTNAVLDGADASPHTPQLRGAATGPTVAVEALILVTVARRTGSVPRQVGAWTSVGVAAVAGTLGGGRLEFGAIACARVDLAGVACPVGVPGAAGKQPAVVAVVVLAQIPALPA
ncbi:XdhC family protein [Roseateles sp.]|uniref:XdhC family protein n=1 Tax=Roseateles sp. TaxID=1971397 RepID=UPI0025ED493E|nr:XdhC family protein [Roseateles sp.]